MDASRLGKAERKAECYALSTVCYENPMRLKRLVQVTEIIRGKERIWVSIYYVFIYTVAHQYNSLRPWISLFIHSASSSFAVDGHRFDH